MKTSTISKRLWIKLSDATSWAYHVFRFGSNELLRKWQQLYCGRCAYQFWPRSYVHIPIYRYSLGVWILSSTVIAMFYFGSRSDGFTSGQRLTFQRGEFVNSISLPLVSWLDYSCTWYFYKKRVDRFLITMSYGYRPLSCFFFVLQFFSLSISAAVDFLSLEFLLADFERLTLIRALKRWEEAAIR